tara:strand:+ start:247 stop:381 length:135 start_codon:yes stop_codon:yes gene_type:complete
LINRKWKKWGWNNVKEIPPILVIVGILLGIVITLLMKDLKLTLQ